MGRHRSWTKNKLKDAVKNSTSIRQVITKLGLVPAGGNYDQVNKYINELELNTKHFRGKGWSKGLTGIGVPRIPTEEILIANSTYQSFKLKKRLYKEKLKKPKCEICGWAKHSPDGRLPLELDHVNGDRHDNRLENLRILCPNCHSLQETHRGRNTKQCRGGGTRYTRDT